MNKRFDPELYKKNDRKAKKALLKILEGTPYTATESQKRTDVDFSVTRDGITFCNIEVEIKSVKWEGDNFPYTTLQIPQRKRKYAVLKLPTIFLVFNYNCSSYATILGLDLLDSKVVEVPNRFVSSGEKFYQVKLSLVKFNSLITVLNKLNK